MSNKSRSKADSVVTSVPGIVKQLRSTFYLILVSNKSRSKADFVVTSVPGIVNQFRVILFLLIILF